MAYTRMFDKLICKCDLCPRVWISESGEIPRRCAGCKSTKWNNQELAQPNQRDYAPMESEIKVVKDGYSQE